MRESKTVSVFEYEEYIMLGDIELCVFSEEEIPSLRSKAYRGIEPTVMGEAFMEDGRIVIYVKEDLDEEEKQNLSSQALIHELEHIHLYRILLPFGKETARLGSFFVSEPSTLDMSSVSRELGPRAFYKQHFGDPEEYEEKC